MNKLREMVLTQMEASERLEYYKTEKERLAKETMKSLIEVALVIAGSLILNFVFYTINGTEDNEYWLCMGALIGIGIMSVWAVSVMSAYKLSLFRAPSNEEMNELRDRII